MADETKVVEAIMGPYRGNRLTMTVADADAAINDHWARDPFAEPAAGEGTRAGEVPEQQHGPLTEEERTAAYEASKAWAQAQWDAAAGIVPPPDPPPEGTLTARQMEKPEGGYRTRGR